MKILKKFNCQRSEKSPWSTRGSIWVMERTAILIFWVSKTNSQWGILAYLHRGPGRFRNVIFIFPRDDPTGQWRPRHRTDSCRHGDQWELSKTSSTMCRRKRCEKCVRTVTGKLNEKQRMIVFTKWAHQCCDHLTVTLIWHFTEYLPILW